MAPITGELAAMNAEWTAPQWVDVNSTSQPALSGTGEGAEGRLGGRGLPF